ncbi:MAG: hypothetical protein WCJ33_05395 [Pseudomonadota bacterium]
MTDEVEKIGRNLLDLGVTVTGANSNIGKVDTEELAQLEVHEDRRLTPKEKLDAKQDPVRHALDLKNSNQTPHHR